ncbi:MAG: hypothetical protein KGN34_16200 [Sphingomonadales bacterium]|nr:hypothetical protein [Sphingomonadales bacterium]
MESNASDFGRPIPSQAIEGDAEAEKAPNPRRHYKSPEDLVDDVHLDLATREDLLREWSHEVDRLLESESEGMSASDPISADRESKLANEARRVNAALATVSANRKEAEARSA